MHTGHPIPAFPDLARLIWARAGRPADPLSLRTITATLPRLLAAAHHLRDQLDTYITHLEGVLASCPDSSRCPAPGCGRPLRVRVGGRQAEYCDDRCRKRARRARPVAAG